MIFSGHKNFKKQYLLCYKSNKYYSVATAYPLPIISVYRNMPKARINDIHNNNHRKVH